MGCIHIYTGDGKGKTTAAMGLAIRAAGQGLRVQVFQFLKGGETGELASLTRLAIPVTRNSRPYGFFSTLTPAEKAEQKQEQDGYLQTAIRLVTEQAADLVILDEVIGAWSLGAVDDSLVRTLLDGAPYGADVVLTGRNAPDWMIAQADYVTVMEKAKHPFDRGIPARKGIEY